MVSSSLLRPGRSFCQRASATSWSPESFWRCRNFSKKKMGRTCPIKSEKAAKFPHHQMMIVKICLTLAIITENHRRSNSCPSDQITPIALWLCEALCSFDWASEQSFCVEIFDGLLFPETLLPLGNCGYGVYIETSGAQTTSFKTHSRWDQKYEILYPLLSTSLEI